ncbi:DNA repair endonuclease XPF [Halyomorpha halys]|uniref:DNA repair endonuclease XPF n=1 Tax=Halyomorpha halys TaxID=286706 RepID=UPI0006D4E24E|nr:DNA repair endonuclease XPF [Halyomorpha halys]XP_014290215.1 DNA repair endonuclease XPF [Halyomorpha halys]
MTMLEFEKQMMLDVLNGDSLLIAAKGLSIEAVILNLIKVYSDPGNLVFVLGATSDEEQFFISELQKMEVTPLPKVISAEVSNSEREKLYLDGGLLFISSRILVVDLLKERVPIPMITGFIVMRAHRILESCQDAFALRLFRQQNHTGFVNAFSRSPQTFTTGLMKLERIMRTLFTTNLHVWPRFHAVVSNSLQNRSPCVVELHVKLSSLMETIQTAALDLVLFCIKEIKRINPMLETEEITVENALSKSFHKLLQLQLDPVWNRLSAKTKQLIADLKTLRSIVVTLTQSDAVRFHSLLTSLRTREYVMKSSGWMILDAAETLFISAKNRLFDSKQNLNPEPNPKWETLTEILEEIQGESNSAEAPPTILILVESKYTVNQLKEVLIMGAKEMLNYWYYKLFGSESLGEMKGKEEEDTEIESIVLTQKKDESNGNTTFSECSEEPDKLKDTAIVIQQFKKDGDGLSLPKILQRLNPSNIIMYDVDISAIRQIEIYQSAFSNKSMKVYFMIYGGSVEEQAYLTSLRREKQAFEKLIKEKSILVLEDLRSGKDLRDRPAVKVSTRQGGAEETPTNSRIIVDMREFRSELPSVIHKRGIDIEPVTLQIGDYILSPDICVERKSISDLIGSLNSGRLYTQAQAMTRYYTKPVLLIEFDENKPFMLQGRYYLSSDISSNDITSKLQLLTLHFPRLRIVWSQSPFASAQLFHELKDGREEPIAFIAAAIGQEETSLEDERLEKFNVGIQDLVSKLPGVNTKNLNSLLNKGKSLDHLITLTKEELIEILGSSLNGELLYNALHNNVKPASEAQTSQFRVRGKGFRKRKHEIT